MYRDNANVSRYCGQHCWEKLNCPAWPERRTFKVAELVRCALETALCEISFDRAVGDCRSRLPQASRIGTEITLILPISCPRARTIKELSAANALAIQCSNDVLIRTSGEAMEQDGLSPQGYAERRCAVVVGRTAAHALALAPGSVEAFDNRAGASFELLTFL